MYIEKEGWFCLSPRETPKYVPRWRESQSAVRQYDTENGEVKSGVMKLSGGQGGEWLLRCLNRAILDTVAKSVLADLVEVGDMGGI
jgi:hypothetical protein